MQAVRESRSEHPLEEIVDELPSASEYSGPTETKMTLVVQMLFGTVEAIWSGEQ